MLTASSLAPAPVVNCDADVLDRALAPMPLPPDVQRPGAYGMAQPAALLAAYIALYGYVSTQLFPWAGASAATWATNHALRQRTAKCLTTLRQQHVIN